LVVYPRCIARGPTDIKRELLDIRRQHHPDITIAVRAIADLHYKGVPIQTVFIPCGFGPSIESQSDIEAVAATGGDSELFASV
jgi:hypothetical protein